MHETWRAAGSSRRRVICIYIAKCLGFCKDSEFWLVSMVYGTRMVKQPRQEIYEEKEAQERFEAALRGALNTTPKPLKQKPKLRKTPRSPTKKPARKS